MVSPKKELIGGILYTAVAKYSGILVNLLTLAVLARLLCPDDFGVVSIAVVIINFFSMVSDMGIGPAVIQNKFLTKYDIRNLFSLTLYIGFLLSLIFYFSSSFFSEFYDNKKLDSIIRLFSFAIFFHCLDIVPNNLLKKEKRFKYIALRTVCTQICCGCLSIILAFLEFGIYSLLVQPILSSVSLFLCDYKQYLIKPKLMVEINSIKKIFSYSTYQFLFSFVNYFSRNFDKLAVGRFFGTSFLGYYEKSYSLMMLPVGNLSHIISPAIQPIFSEYQNDKEWLFHKSMGLIKLLTLIGFPLSVFLHFSSYEIIMIVFGKQWIPAVSIFKIFSLSIGFQIVYSPQGAFFQSANAVKEMFKFGIITASLNFFAIYVGCILLNSLESLAWCICLAYCFAFFGVYYVLTKKVFNQSFKRFISILYEPMIISVLLAVLFKFISSEVVIESIIISFFVKLLSFFIVMCLFEIKTKYFRTLIKL